MGICGLKGQQVFVSDAIRVGTTPKKKKRRDFNNLSSSEKLTVGYHQIPNTFNPNSTAKKRNNNNNEGSIEEFRLGQPAGLVGIKNLGNTCFINSALQCLLNVQPLMDYFLSDLHEEETNVENPLGSQGMITNQFADLSRNVWCEREKYITPTAFKSVVQQFSSVFGDGSQQDSQEFLIFLLDYLHEDLNRVKEKPYIKDKDYESKDPKEWEGNSLEAWRDYLQRNKSIVVDLFQGQLKSTLKCLDCGTVSHKFETFMYLSVPISEEMQQASHSLITIDDCIEEFTREETLDETEWWLCTHCKKRTPSTKKIDLWKTPNILIVHFKRFTYSKKSSGKINSFIDFKLTQFDLSSQVAGKEKVKPIYDLFAVCNHSGSLKGGHYTAYAKNRDLEEWHYFDDKSVSKVANPLKSILSAKAYVLFYSKTSPEKFQRQTLTFPEFWPHVIRSNTLESKQVSSKIESEFQFQQLPSSNFLALAKHIPKLEESRRTFTTLGIQKEESQALHSAQQTPAQQSIHRGISAVNRAGITKQESNPEKYSAKVDKGNNQNIFGGFPKSTLATGAGHANGFPMWDDEKHDALAKFTQEQQQPIVWKNKHLSLANQAGAGANGSTPTGNGMTTIGGTATATISNSSNHSTLTPLQRQQTNNGIEGISPIEYSIKAGGASANHPLTNSIRKRGSKELFGPMVMANPMIDSDSNGKRGAGGVAAANDSRAANANLFNSNASQILLQSNRKVSLTGTLPKIDAKQKIGKLNNKNKEIEDWLVSSNLFTRSSNVASGSAEEGGVDGRLALIKQRVGGAQSAMTNYHSQPGGVVVVKQSSQHFGGTNNENLQLFNSTGNNHSNGYSKAAGTMNGAPANATLGSLRVEKKQNADYQFSSLFSEENDKDIEIQKAGGYYYQNNMRSASQNKQYSTVEQSTAVPQSQLAKRGFTFEKPGLTKQLQVSMQQQQPQQQSVRETTEESQKGKNLNEEYGGAGKQQQNLLKNYSSSNFNQMNGQAFNQQSSVPSQSQVFAKETKPATFTSSASTAATFDQSPNRQRKVKNSTTNNIIMKPSQNPHMMFSISKNKRAPIDDDFDDF